MSDLAWEYNFDGLIGPTHNYAGLSFGNKASIKHGGTLASPRKAALEGLEKMKFLMDRGFRQALLPPQPRPALDFLKKLGFSGSPENQIQSAYKFSPALLSACYSSSNMWTANSVTVSPSADTEDKKVHFTPANLQSFLHRSLETEQTALVLKKVFSDSRFFVHHPPLPALPDFSDEGSANHSRLCSDYGEEALEMFVYGRKSFSLSQGQGQFFPRQSDLACKLIARSHKLKKTLFVPQNLSAIEEGVFHNDVIFTGDRNLIFYHEKAFPETEKTIYQLEEKTAPLELLKISVKESEISLKEAVSSYLFNSQLLSKGKNRWLLLAPKECEENQKVKDYLETLKEKGISEIHFVSLQQSMQNGGGPACLRLRVVLTEEEAKTLPTGILLNPKLYEQLKVLIKSSYRDRIKPEDLKDPLLIRESETILDELSQILGLGLIYPFQRA